MAYLVLGLQQKVATNLSLSSTLQLKRQNKNKIINIYYLKMFSLLKKNMFLLITKKNKKKTKNPYLCELF